MADNAQEKTGSKNFFADWVKMTTEFWAPMAQMWIALNQTRGMTSNSTEDDKKPGMQESWDAAQKTWQSFSQGMSEPDTMETFLKGVGMLPEIFLKIFQTGLTTSINFQERWMEDYGRLQESAKSYTDKDVKENAFKAWTRLYEQEFRKFFKIPQLGLTRLYQEKMIRWMDKFNIYQAELTKFFSLLLGPMEKSFQVLPEKLKELVKKGDLPDDSRKYYQIWIKILEEHYITLFQSPEYNCELNKALDSMMKFSQAKKEILQDVMNTLPVPTHKEMDELYKEVYLLKKRIKELEKKK